MFVTDDEGGVLEKTREPEDLLPRAVQDLIYENPHQWSHEPCETCRAVSVILGAPFGCYRLQAEKRI